MPPRTRISNGKLAFAFLVGIAALGLGPVAHMMLNPSVSSTLNHQLITFEVLSAIWRTMMLQHEQKHSASPQQQ
jgi:hypothetical protein